MSAEAPDEADSTFSKGYNVGDLQSSDRSECNVTSMQESGIDYAL